MTFHKRQCKADKSRVRRMYVQDSTNGPQATGYYLCPQCGAIKEIDTEDVPRENFGQTKGRESVIRGFR